MPEMYCPQCGRKLVLDSGEIRFCRYCGFSLVDTKEALHGYSEQKRVGFSIVTWSYVMLLLVTLLLHGKYVSLDTGWVYWLLTALIVVSVSFFCSAAVSAMKPAMFAKRKPRDQAALDPQKNSVGVLGSAQARDTSLIQPSRAPLTNLSSGRNELVQEPRSVVEATTKILDDRNQAE